MAKLPVSRIVNVDVDLAPPAARAQDLSTLLLLGSADVIDVTERIRTYAGLDAVASDFGTLGAEYGAAVLYFGQKPQPDQLKIGRWAASDSQGKLVCAPLSAANKLVSAWTGIADGGFAVDVNGVAQPVSNCDFSLQTTLNGIASVIQAALPGATVVYNAVYGRFEVESNALGAGSTVGFLTTAGGTDISAMMGGRADSSGAYVADGIAAESALECAQIFDARFGQTWYALSIPETTNDDDHVAVAGYIEGATNKHLYGVSTQQGGVLSSVSTTDIASKLKALGYRRTIVQYSSESPYSVASLLGRALTVDYNENSSVITLMFKDEPGIVGEELTPTQVDALEAKNANVFVDYDNDTTIIEAGKCSSGDYIDEITGTDWLAVETMNRVFNLLFQNKKIPQTDPGVHLIVTTVEQVCEQAVDNGLVAPGVWKSGGFGALKTDQFMPKGYYVFAQSVNDQSDADRALRLCPPIQVAIKLAGAIHDVNITVNVNR